MNNAFKARPRQAVLRANAALSVCALALASLTMASRAKDALAYGPEDGVCANIIGSANCPNGYSDLGFVRGAESTTCHLSNAWYAFGIPAYGPYYNCCTYIRQIRECAQNGGPSEYPPVEYFRANSYGDARCVQDMYSGPNHRCVNT